MLDYYGVLTLSQTSDFRLFKTKEFADDNFRFDKNNKVLQMGRKHWENEKLLVTSNFLFSHSVF